MLFIEVFLYIYYVLKISIFLVSLSNAFIIYLMEAFFYYLRSMGREKGKGVIQDYK